MRIFILLAVCIVYGGANYYAASRVYRFLTLIGKNVNTPVYIVIFSILAATVLLSFAGGGSGLRRAISAVASVWMGIIMYLLIFTLAADIVILVFRLAGNAGKAVKIAAEASVLILTAVVVISGAVHAANVKTARYSVDSGKNGEPVRIVLLSDIHIGALGTERRLQKIAGTINAEKPDIVCIAGDIFNNDYSSVQDPDAVAKAFRSIESQYGVYACLGNHDCGNGFTEMLKLLSDSDVTLLREDECIIPGCCVVYGRADSSPIGGTDTVRKRVFDVTGLSGQDNLPVIVLDHNPANMNEYDRDVSLVLCGHTHKGQLFPGSLITGSMYTVDYGMYRAGNGGPTVIVTSGVGYWGPPLRVGTDSEIAVIDFR